MPRQRNHPRRMPWHSNPQVPWVPRVCSFSPMLMSRNLFYTAVTRARDMVVLVGSEKTIQNMTMNNQFHQRFTGLTEKLVAVKKFVAEKEENS